MSRPLKLAVAESSALLRKGVISILEGMPSPAVEIFEIDDMTQLGVRLRRHRPDLVIFNPASPGSATPRQLREQTGCDDLKCVVLQMTMLDEAVLRNFDGVISVCDSAEQIRSKIVSLFDVRPVHDTRQEPLSPREREIVVCIVKGMTNKQIADCLCISAHTVITHRRNIAAKLQIHSAAGLTIYAIVNKLVELSQIESSINEI